MAIKSDMLRGLGAVVSTAEVLSGTCATVEDGKKEV